MIDILDRIKLFEILSKLHATDKPKFGAMTPGNMVEHLALVIRFSNGKEPQQHRYATDQQQKINAFITYAGKVITIDFKCPLLPTEGLPTFKHFSLTNVIDNLKTELNDFDNYFLQHPSDKPVSPIKGELNYEEWVRFHNRHFTHHFNQFRLL